MSLKLPNKKIVAVLVAYNAEKTLARTYEAIPKDWVDEVILCDDKSRDKTVELSRSLGIRTFVHKRNRGYGGNQKTCYREALKLGADIAVMVHPDFQYDPKFIPELVKPIARGEADAVFGSRMMNPKDALSGGMPRWKWFANIALTKIENFILSLSLTEYHSGFRAYSRKALELPIELNSDAFVFDTEIIAQLKIANMRIEEIPITTRYFPEASMIGLGKSIQYGLSILGVMGKFLIHQVWPLRQFDFQNLDNGGIVCELCGNKKTQLLYPATTSDLFSKPYRVTEEEGGKHGEIRQCLVCSVAFVPQTELLKKDLANYYTEAPLDSAYIADEEGRRKSARRVLKNVKEKTNGKRLLDVGANVGILLDEARRQGFVVSGVESSKAARDYAKEHFNLDVGPTIPDGIFDCVTVLDVFEHVLGPKDLAMTLAQKLDTGGLLVLTVPDITSLTARLFGRFWHALVPGHLFFFSSTSIEYLADQVDLEVISRRPYRRCFSFNYILSRLLKSPNVRVPLVGSLVLPITTFDEHEIVLRKI